MEHLEHYVLRAADEFRAAARASSPEAEEAHRLLAIELIHLIKCDGNATSYRLLRNRRASADGPPRRLATLSLVTSESTCEPAT